MRNKLIILAILICLVFTVSCNKNEEALNQIRVRPVKITEIREAEHPIILKYMGTVLSEDVKRISFKTSGIIEEILVKKGDRITLGQELARLDITDLTLEVNAAEDTMKIAHLQYEKASKGAQVEDIRSAEANVDKAQNAYTFTKNMYEKLKKLYDEGAISQTKLDEAKLELDISLANLEESKQSELKIKGGVRKEDLNSVFYQYKQAETNFIAMNSLLEDSVLKSNIDGYVIDVLYKEDERVVSGMPVLVIRNDNEIINIGLTIEDLDKVELEHKATVQTKHLKLEGKITSINEMPDEETRTYNTEITINNNDRHFKIGQIVDVNIHIGKDKGIWIPITAILSNGIDYVFVVENSKASKKEISILEVKGTNVKVDGLNSGDKLVIEGMTKLNQGDSLTIIR